MSNHCFSMGFEDGKLSIDQIQAGLDDGSIERGDKGEERITAPNATEIIFYRETGEIQFEITEGVTAKVDLQSTAVGLMRTVDGETIYNSTLADSARHETGRWKDMGLFETKQ